jgi:hypothetical protein
METQADISARQLAEMQAERRPWVSIDLAVGSITWGPDGAKVIGSYELKNSGHRPAMNVFVQDAVVPFFGPDPHDNVLDRVKEILEVVQKNPGMGFALFPDQSRSVGSTNPLTQKDVVKFQDWFRSLKSPGAPADAPLRAAPNAIPLVIVYAIDYGGDVEGAHHQDFCWAFIGPRDPANPNGGTLPTPINSNLSASEIKVVYGSIGCGAN